MKHTPMRQSALKQLVIPILILLVAIIGILPVLAQGSNNAPDQTLSANAPSTTLLVTNSPDKSTALVGDTVIYTYVVVNHTSELLAITGRDEISGDLVWIPGGSGTFGPPTLIPPGEQATATTSYTIQAADLPGPLVNTVFITGTAQSNPSPPPVFNGQATASVELLQKFSVNPNDSAAQTLITDDNVLTMVISPQALPANAQQLIYVSQNGVPTGSSYPFSAAGIAFSLDLLDGLGNVIPNPSFHPPWLATINYADSNLPVEAQGVNEGKLMVYVLDDNTNMWQNVPVISRDIIGNSITVYLSHLTDYAVGGPRVMFLPTLRRSN